MSINNTILSRFQGSLFGSLIGTKLILSEPSFFLGQRLREQLLEKLLEKETISSVDWQEITPDPLSLTSSEWLIGLLPLILLFHDEPHLFWEHLDPLIAQNQLPSSIFEEIQLGFDCFRFILRDKGPLTELGQIIQTDLETERPLTEMLKICQKHSSDQFTSLRLSLYCFCRTPTHFRLSLGQAAQTQNVLICALTGALSGAYNGHIGIPRNWRLALSQEANLPRFQQQMVTLWAMWTGIDNFPPLQLSLQNVAVTSVSTPPQFPGLKLISQKEY